MSEEGATYEADDPQHPNNLVVRGRDGDPLPHANATRMIEVESCERVIEGLKMAADACAHLAKHEPLKASVWTDIATILDKMRRDATTLAGIGLTMRQNETQSARGEPYPWRKARDRFLDGIKQATGGMRQLAVCFRSDYLWSFMAQQLERHDKRFRAMLMGQRALPNPSRLILPPGFVRH